MKTAELQGAALDWAVAKCEGYQTARMVRGSGYMPDSTDKAKHYTRADVLPGQLGSGFARVNYTPSTNWSQGGAIIEREGLALRRWYDKWTCEYSTGSRYFKSGPTPLIAAMRCYVASKLGDEVDVPGELR